MPALQTETVYVKRWLRTKHAILFRLSNRTVQVSAPASMHIDVSTLILPFPRILLLRYDLRSLNFSLPAHASLISAPTLQVNFMDHTEIILASAQNLATFTDKAGVRTSYALDSMLEQCPSPELYRRIKYTKEILAHMLNTRR